MALALPLLMSGVGADDHDAAVALDDSAVVTHFFDAGSNLHSCVLSCDLHVAGATGGCGRSHRVDVSPERLNSCLLVAVGDATSFEVVRGELYLDAIAGKNPDVMHAHLAGDMSQDFVAVL